MPLLLAVLFVVVPLAELYVIIRVGEAIGALPTIGLLVLDSLLGAWLLRAQGRLAWRRFRRALAEGRPPAREVLDGALVILGGALLLTPGFLTDVLGLLLLIPPTRALVRRSLGRHFRSRLLIGLVAHRPGGDAAPPPARQDHDMDATAHDADPPLPRG